MPHVDSDHLTQGEGDLLDEQLTPSWSSELSQRLYELVHLGDLECTKFKRGLQALEREHQDAVYPELLYLLCHLRFEPQEAKDHWQRIVEHRESMATAMQSTVDLRVALVSYFLDAHALLESPSVIELAKRSRARRCTAAKG